MTQSEARAIACAALSEVGQIWNMLPRAGKDYQALWDYREELKAKARQYAALALFLQEREGK